MLSLVQICPIYIPLGITHSYKDWEVCSATKVSLDLLDTTTQKTSEVEGFPYCNQADKQNLYNMTKKQRPAKKSIESKVENESNAKHSQTQRSVIFLGVICGVVGLLGAAYLIFVNKSVENQIQHYFLKILISLSGAGFSLCLTGFIKLKYDIPGGGALESGGALAVFLIVFWLFPNKEVESKPFRIISLIDNVDLSNWRPYNQNEHRTVKVTRTFQIRIKKDPNNKTVDYRDAHATSSLDGLDIFPISDNMYAEELENPTEIGKRSYMVSISNAEFHSDTIVTKYKIDYWNCHKLDSSIYKKNDISKNIPYPTKLYVLKVLFPIGYSWQSITFFSTSPNGKETRKEFTLKNIEGLPTQTFVDSLHNLEAGTMLRYFLKGFTNRQSNL